jgi:predicted transcriptional regulator of viral defense system
MAATLGPFETQLLAYTQSRARQSLAAGELVTALGWTPVQERKILSRLAHKGIIVRLRRGLYLMPSRLPLGGRWSPGEFLALSALINDRGGRYQISGPNAFYRYGWSDQVPNRLYAYNNCLCGDRRIGTVTLTLIKVADERLGGTETVQTPDGVGVVYATKARSLVDAVDDWSRFDSLPNAFGWMRREVEKSDDIAVELVQMTIRFGNRGTARRIGAMLERLDVREPLLRRLEKQIRPSSSLIPWNPNREKRGTTNRRWGVVINDDQ